MTFSEKSCHSPEIQAALEEAVQIQELINSVHEKYTEKIRSLDQKRSAAIHACIFGGTSVSSTDDLNSLGKSLDAEEIQITQKYYTATKELEEAFRRHMTKLLRAVQKHAK